MYELYRDSFGYADTPRCFSRRALDGASPRLGAAAIKGAVAQAGIAAADITDCLMGNVLSAGQGQAPARQAALQAGLPSSVRCVTINKVCGSGLQAVMQAAHALQAGVGAMYVAGAWKICRSPLTCYPRPVMATGWAINKLSIQ